MTTLIVITVTLLIAILIDHTIFWKRLENFEKRVNELIILYNVLLTRVQYGDEYFPGINEFQFDGEYYNIYVKKGDYISFYTQLSTCIKDVINAYEEIGERYMSLMDYETEMWITQCYNKIQEINGIIRYQLWLNNGIK